MSGRWPALFLDRDGVINVDHGHVHRIVDFEFVPGIFDLARFVVRNLGWPIVVVTNQAGIGRGLYDEAAFQALTHWMCERFEAESAPIARVYHCPYHPEHGVGRYRQDHPWRKPNPGMLLQAAKDLELDLARSALVGDRISDIECAHAAGLSLRILVDADATLAPDPTRNYEVAHDLRQTLSLLRRKLVPSR
jgi:D-glycero-D-manno-heptose 1,7-bisphosphate phosphatase